MLAEWVLNIEIIVYIEKAWSHWLNIVGSLQAKAFLKWTINICFFMKQNYLWCQKAVWFYLVHALNHYLWCLVTLWVIHQCQPLSYYAPIGSSMVEGDVELCRPPWETAADVARFEKPRFRHLTYYIAVFPSGWHSSFLFLYWWQPCGCTFKGDSHKLHLTHAAGADSCISTYFLFY